MKRKLIIGSIFIVTILVLVSFVSAVGFQSIQTNEKESSSPLFTIRTQRAIQTESASGLYMFLGKGKQLNIFPAGTQNEELIKTAIKIFIANPTLLNRLLDNLDKFPALTRLLIKYGVTILEIKNYMRMIQDNPSLLTEELNNIQLFIPHDDSPQPQGLSTSSALGCFIMAMLVLLPLTVVLTLFTLLFTIRILTCLNVNDCGNAIANQIWNQLIQGLTPE